DPTADPTAQPEDPTSDPTSQPTSQPTEASTEASTDSGGSDRPEPGSPIMHGEFPDWKFSLGSAKFAADKVGGWTYDSCDTVDGQGELAANDCERAVELAYSAYSGHLKAVQVIMAFPSEAAAKTAATRLAKLPAKAVKWRRDQALDTFVYGKIRSGAIKKYVVLTVVTADRTARAKATKFHHYLQADHKNYFLFRDL
ncbi:PT domain-containing protein, partial [Nonomuraea longispora]|uniref:PT domain-containing protein n=1 Tax=Nonomuraea longispora TaxID=1848320 RepID=UPI0015F2B0F3